MQSEAKIDWPMQLRQLAVMIDAGLPIDAALKSLVGRSGKHSLKLKKAQRLVERGMSLPDALQRALLVKDFDHAMLRCADAAGRVSDGLNHISERRVSQLQRAASFKTSLILPKVIVFLGGLAGIFVKVASGNHTLAEAATSVGIVVLYFYLMTYLAMLAVKADSRIWMSWFWPYPFLRKVNEWHRIALEYLFYNNLVWQISAGVDFSKATKGTSQLLKSKSFQRSVNSASHSMATGLNITQALMNEGLILTDRLRQVLLIADQSGKHEAAIKHELSLQAMVLKQKSLNFFKMAPRVFYVMALLVISKLIIS